MRAGKKLVHLYNWPNLMQASKILLRFWKALTLTKSSPLGPKSLTRVLTTWVFSRITLNTSHDLQQGKCTHTYAAFCPPWTLNPRELKVCIMISVFCLRKSHDVFHGLHIFAWPALWFRSEAYTRCKLPKRPSQKSSSLFLCNTMQPHWQYYKVFIFS